MHLARIEYARSDEKQGGRSVGGPPVVELAKTLLGFGPGLKASGGCQNERSLRAFLEPVQPVGLSELTKQRGGSIFPRCHRSSRYMEESLGRVGPSLETPNVTSALIPLCHLHTFPAVSSLTPNRCSHLFNDAGKRLLALLVAVHSPFQRRGRGARPRGEPDRAECMIELLDCSLPTDTPTVDDTFSECHSRVSFAIAESVQDPPADWQLLPQVR